MLDEIEDFWPDLSEATVVTPVGILKTQAAVLTKKTRGMLQGEVSSVARSDGAIIHHLYVVVPALNGYRFKLLTIHHNQPFFYPVYIAEAPVGPSYPWFSEGKDLRVDGLPNQEKFQDWLRTTFSSERTKEILESLLAQAVA